MQHIEWAKKDHHFDIWDIDAKQHFGGRYVERDILALVDPVLGDGSSAARNLHKRTVCHSLIGWEKLS